ncbi:hypothetical protein [Caulobacter sp. NIBR1757]|uniref:hypothetical protein n=1 Tax=Caulobacter sp. NIBR1757 TaxID=3016000 RepID=UPI0022F0DDF3|nr:hypothetical protein [Caulobacter sp. NIBR1757]WGM37498.1 hypothetical protein AMEJIAPC_00396 [Caulobacter sp. NIBR1757]
MRAVGILLLTGLFLAAGCSQPSIANLCENTEISRVSSPDGRHDAVLFERSCGATTGFSSQVSIVRHAAKVDGSGNVVVLDDDQGAAPAAAWGGPDVDLGWTAADQLVVRHHPSARVSGSRKMVDGVAIVRVADLEDRTAP